MNIICQAHVAHNTGWSAEMNQGQGIRVSATLSPCPDLAIGGKPVDVVIYQP